jgi:hypothetical protein
MFEELIRLETLAIPYRMFRVLTKRSRSLYEVCNKWSHDRYVGFSVLCVCSKCTSAYMDDFTFVDCHVAINVIALDNDTYP